MAAFSLLFYPVLLPGHFQPYVCLLSHLSLIHEIFCSHLVKYIIYELKRHKISFLHQECESQTAISWKRDMTCMNGVQRVLKKYEESGQWEQQTNSICSHRNRKKYSHDTEPKRSIWPFSWSIYCLWMNGCQGVIPKPLFYKRDKILEKKFKQFWKENKISFMGIFSVSW